MPQQTHRQIHFTQYIPGRKKKEKEGPLLASVSVKHGLLILPGTTLKKLGMVDKFIRLYYEPTKKIIGWQIVNDSLNQEQLKTAKLVKIYPATNNYKTTITPMLREFKGLKKESYTSLEVKKYVETGLLDRGTTYYYVKLKDTDDGEED